MEILRRWLDNASCAALRTCAFDFRAGAAACRTFADLLEVAEEGSLCASHVAAAVTSWARVGCAAGFAAGAAAPRTDFASHRVGLAAGAENGITERHTQRQLDVSASSVASSGRTTEE